MKKIRSDQVTARVYENRDFSYLFLLNARITFDKLLKWPFCDECCGIMAVRRLAIVIRKENSRSKMPFMIKMQQANILKKGYEKILLQNRFLR